MIIYKTLGFVIIGSIIACAGTGAVASTNPVGTKVVPVNEDFDLAVGATASIDGGALSLTFVKAGPDSRCPTGVQCVWGGNGAVLLTVAPSTTAKTTVTLNTNLTPEETTVGPYEISLIGLKPHPKYGSTIPAASYVATFRVKKQ